MHHFLLSMRKLLEKYYNINYYCTYKLLFILCWRILNPFYWLSLSKWDNRYIKYLVSSSKKAEEAGMDKGIYLPYSSRALITPFIIICWIFSHKWLKDFFEYIVLCSYKSSLWDSCP